MQCFVSFSGFAIILMGKGELVASLFQDFDMNYVSVPADKTANNVGVVV